MPTTQVRIGPVETLTQNVAFALPARQVRVMSSLAIDVSLDGSTWAALANATTGADCTAAFVRCTTGNALFVARV
jgi:hypothetical protein